MAFSSVNFLLLLPFLVAAYWLLPRDWRRAWLVVASFLVYIAAGWRDFFLLIAVTAANWLAHRLWPRSAAARRLAIVGNIAVLAWFKYRYFIAANIGLPAAGKLIIPLGLSFYIFQLIAYQIEILHGVISAAPTFFAFLLYIFFFPHHQSGPIMRPHQFLKSFREGRTWRAPRFKIGILILLWGLFKKIWIADFLMAPWVNGLYKTLAASHGAQGCAPLLAVGYGIQIYADFSGYSDIAVGLGRLFGFKLDRNFHQPFLAKSASEFWRRWHVTLSRWLQDFLFLPASVTFIEWREKIFGSNADDDQRAPMFAAMLVTMALGGLWHGANWTFLIWGFLHGFYLIAENLAESALARLRALRLVVAQAFLMLAWIPFRATNAGDVWALVSRWSGWAAPEALSALALFAAAILFCAFEERLEKNFVAIVRRALALPPGTLALGCGMALYLLICGIKHETAFIYQRF